MIFPNWVFTRCFRTRKRGKHALGNLHIVLTRGERIVLLMKVSPCYDIMPVRKEEGKSYWKIPFCDDDATREK